MEENLLIVVSGPSGAGKGTICKALLEVKKNIVCAISATSREIRPHEVDGINYHYITKEEFEEKIKRDEFLEYAEVYGNYYGTIKKDVFDDFSKGLDVILEIDIQGALQIKKNYNEAICIFIVPPTFKVLKERIHCRGRESDDEINRRLHQVRDELSYISKYDYIVINDQVEKAVSQVRSILTSEKLRLKKDVFKADIFLRKYLSND